MAGRPVGVGGHRRDSLKVYCEHCAEEIEGCTGAHGDWMHTRTRFEHCATGGRLAMPKLPSDDRVFR